MRRKPRCGWARFSKRRSVKNSLHRLFLNPCGRLRYEGACSDGSPDGDQPRLIRDGRPAIALKDTVSDLTRESDNLFSRLSGRKMFPATGIGVILLGGIHEACHQRVWLSCLPVIDIAQHRLIAEFARREILCNDPSEVVHRVVFMDVLWPRFEILITFPVREAPAMIAGDDFTKLLKEVDEPYRMMIGGRLSSRRRRRRGGRFRSGRMRSRC